MILDLILFSQSAPISIAVKPGQKNTPGLIHGIMSEMINEDFLNWLYKTSVQDADKICMAIHEDQIPESETAIRNFSDLTASVFFNSRYFTFNGYPVIMVFAKGENENQSESVKNVRGELNSFFQYLGYDEYYYCYLVKDQGIIDTNLPATLGFFNRLEHKEKLESWYPAFLEREGDFRKLVLFIKDHKETEWDVYSEMEGIEHEYKKTNPHLFNLIETRMRFGRKLEENEIRVQGLRKELESKEAYVSNLQIPQTDLKKVVDFYYYEYEILPLWYKRLGHILKVISGKRNFKSLFNEKVKKYKD